MIDKHIVPFNWQVYRTTEAVWDISKRDTIEMFRMTRRGIGEFLNPESKRPQSIIDKIIARNPHLKEASLPVMVTVTNEYCRKHSCVAVTHECPTRTRQIVVGTYDIWGIYQITVESGLPMAKEFLRRFPILLEALQTRTIKPPAIGNIKPEILAFFGVPWKERGKYQQEVCSLYGWSTATFYRKANSAALMLGIPPEETRRTGRPRKTRSDKGSYINSEEHKRVIILYNQNKSKKEVALITGVHYSKVTRWTRTA